MTITMKSTTTTAVVVVALAAALMLSFALVVFIPQADGAAPPRAIRFCNSHSPNGGQSSPPCGPSR